MKTLISQLLSILHKDTSPRRQCTVKLLHALETFSTHLDGYAHLFIPAIVSLFEQPENPLSVRRAAIVTLGRLCMRLDFSDYASRIIHPLARILDAGQTTSATSANATTTTGTAELSRREAMETLCALVYQLRGDYVIFIPMMNKIMAKQGIQHVVYANLVRKLEKNESLLPEDITEISLRSWDHNSGLSSVDGDTSSSEMTVVRKLIVNESILQKAWDTSQRATKEDWADWIRRFSVELLRESSSPALRACLPMAQVYYPLARELFNASFLSCWTELHENYQDQLVANLEHALKAPNNPPEILQVLLNLAEFMEHGEKPLPVNIQVLAHLAEKCAAYAKALHYREMEFRSSPTAATCEALISINNQLGQPEASVGILQYARKHHDIELKEGWYEKLHRWDAALRVYEKKQLKDPRNLEYTLGRMRCLAALSEVT